MGESIKDKFKKFNELIKFGRIENYLPILKIGIEIGKISNNDEEKEFINEFEKNIERKKEHKKNFDEFISKLEKYIKIIIDKDLSKNGKIDIIRESLSNDIERNFSEHTQELLGCCIHSAEFVNSDNDVRINLKSTKTKGLINSIFNMPPFSIDISSDDGGDVLEWRNDKKYFLYFSMHSDTVNEEKLLEYQKKLNDLLEGQWGKNFLLESLKGN